MPATRAARSDGVLLARDALGAALVPGLRVLPGPGVAAGHQALLAAAAAAARPACLPRAPRPLVLRAPEGNGREGRRRMVPRTPGGRRGGLLPPFPFIAASCTDLSGPACGSRHLSTTLGLLRHSAAEKGKQAWSPWSGHFGGWEDLYRDSTEKERPVTQGGLQLLHQSCAFMDCILKSLPHGSLRNSYVILNNAF